MIEVVYHIPAIANYVSNNVPGVTTHKIHVKKTTIKSLYYSLRKIYLYSGVVAYLAIDDYKMCKDDIDKLSVVMNSWNEEGAIMYLEKRILSKC